MRATVKLLDGVSFEAQADSGPKVVMDGAPEYGGQNRGPRPMELVLMGMGGCTAFDVVYILRRQRQDVSDCRVELEAERAPTDPKVFTRIHVHFVVTGRKLKDEQVRRAVELSAEKYCSASIMLGKTAAITHDYEIVAG
jgi:putative redox protein